MRLLLPLLFLLSVLACNKPKAVAEKAYSNDTAEVLRMLIDSATIHCDYQKLYENNPYGDSIIIFSGKLDQYYIKHAFLKMKFMTKDEICNIASLNGNFPDVIEPRIYNDGDTLYTAALIRSAVFPVAEHNGTYYNPATNSQKEGNLPCAFDTYCGMSTYRIRVASSTLHN